MALIVFGIVVILVGAFAAKNTPISKYKTLVILGGIVVTAIGVATSAIRIVPPGHVGVQVLFGDVKETYLEDGMNFVNPLVNVEEMSVQLQNYTMSAVTDEGQRRGFDAIRVLSKDGLEVIINLTALYNIKKAAAPRLFQDVGLDYESKAIRPLMNTRIRESAKNYDAIELYSDKREEFKNKIFEDITKDFDTLGIRLKEILIGDIDLPKSVKESIERKITAVQEEQRMKYVVDKEKREAERKEIEANGQARYQRILDSALTKKVLQYELIQVQKELVNSPNSKIIMLGGDGGGNVPVIIGK